jgi:hypothetical protein
MFQTIENRSKSWHLDKKYTKQRVELNFTYALQFYPNDFYVISEFFDCLKGLSWIQMFMTAKNIFRDEMTGLDLL